MSWCVLPLFISWGAIHGRVTGAAFSSHIGGTEASSCVLRAASSVI